MKQSAYDLESNSPPLLPHDEVLSNILHLLWSNTSTSPFLCSSPLPPERNATTTTTTTSDHGDCDTPSHSFSLLNVAFRGSEQSGIRYFEESIAPSTTKKTHKYFLQNFLADFSDAYCKKWEGDLEGVFKIFTTNLHHEGGEDGDLSTMSDENIWFAGLKLLQRILFDNEEEIDTIAPHDLLRTVMDSFHFQDKELDVANFIPINHQLSRQQAQTQNIHDLSHTYYHYPSSVAMFILYNLLISHAIHLAATQTEESLSALELRDDQHTGQRTTVIRWRRLKSMVDDAQSIYQRMLLQFIEKTARKNWCSDDDGINRNCDNSSGNTIGPMHILHLASWLYTNHLLPSCRQLLMLILKNTVKTNANPSSNPRVWEPCMKSFGILTTLMALNCCFAENHDLADICSGTTSTNGSLLVVKCIDDSLNNELYDTVTSSVTSSAEEGIGEETSPERDSDNARYYIGRGAMLAEDILLLPLGFHKNTSYDELGIAMIAYHRLVAQTQQSKNNQPSLTTLPYPFSGGRLWALYFPNIKTLLDGPWKSSILKTLICSETPSSLIEDDFIALINVKITVLGLNMLHKLIHEAPFVRPSHQYLESTKKHNHIWQYSHSSNVLGSTIKALLSLVLRISTLEAAQSAEKVQGNKVKLGSNNNLALKYTSQQVASMAKSLMGFYTPSMQVIVIREISRKMKQDNVNAVLLPKVLDWMRPLLMTICKNTASISGISRDIVLANNMTTVMDPFFADLDNLFDESSPLPRDVCDFFSSIETFTSLFALFRLLKTWIIQANKCYETMDVQGDCDVGHDSLSQIVVWADKCTEKLIKFDSRLSLLIDYWTQFASGKQSNHSMTSSEAIDGCPHDFHRCFLLRFHLDEVLSIK